MSTVLEAPELQYLNEYAQYLNEVGEVAFRVIFSGSVLLGLGMVARVLERPRGWARRTLGREGLEELSAVASVTARVWRLRKDRIRSDASMITLGQSVDNDIVIAEYTVSTHHCAFGFDPTGMVICDAGSLNGTSVNGNLLEAGVQVRLRDKSHLVLGRLELQYLQAESFFEKVRNYANRMPKR